MFVGGFLIVLLANGIMMTVAFTTWTGLSTQDAYSKGVAYNSAITARDTQASLGWSVGLTVEPSTGDANTLIVKLVDRDGAPILGATVVAEFRRPSDANLDQTLVLQEAGAGRYSAPATLPARGQWDVVVAIDANGTPYNARRRVMVP